MSNCIQIPSHVLYIVKAMLLSKSLSIYIVCTCVGLPSEIMMTLVAYGGETVDVV